MFDILDTLLYTADNTNKSNFPKYDLYTENDKTVLEIAVAGYKKEDIDVSVKNNYLVIKTVDGYTSEDYPRRKYINSGLAKRKFLLSFKINTKYEISDCRYTDGILRIEVISLGDTDTSKKIAIL